MLWLARVLERASDEALEMRRVIRATLAAWRRELNSLEAIFPHEEPSIPWCLVLKGGLILTGSADDTAHLCGARIGKRLQHGGDVHEVAFSPNGSRLLTAGFDNTALLWGRKTGKLLHKFAHEGVVFGAAFSPDGSWMVRHTDSVSLGSTASGCIDFGHLLVALTRVGHIHLMHQTSMTCDVRICTGGIGRRSELSAEGISWSFFLA
jgi:hypothetical protein